MLSSKLLSRQLRTIASRTTTSFSSALTRSPAAVFLTTRKLLSPEKLSLVSDRYVAFRAFSGGPMPLRAFPQYTIFGTTTALSVRSILPQFKRAGSDGVSVERRGKLVLEFVPRAQTGAGFLWKEKTPFSLSVEEIGLCISQLPGNPVELSHAYYGSESDDEGSRSGVTQTSGDNIEKVLTIQQSEGSCVKFTIDYMKNGVGGEVPSGVVFSVSCDHRGKLSSQLMECFFLRVCLLTLLFRFEQSGIQPAHSTRSDRASWGIRSFEVNFSDFYSLPDWLEHHYGYCFCKCYFTRCGKVVWRILLRIFFVSCISC